VIAAWSDRLAAVACLLGGCAITYVWLRWCDR